MLLRQSWWWNRSDRQGVGPLKPSQHPVCAKRLDLITRQPGELIGDNHLTILASTFKCLLNLA